MENNHQTNKESIHQMILAFVDASQDLIDSMNSNSPSLEELIHELGEFTADTGKEYRLMVMAIDKDVESLYYETE